jgi:hypothetical protein
MNRRILELLCKSSLSPVTDGLTFWLDGRDGIYNISTYERITSADAVASLVKNRVDNTYYQHYSNITASSALVCRDNGDGFLTYIQRSTANAAEHRIAGNAANVRTVEAVFWYSTNYLTLNDWLYFLRSGSLQFIGNRWNVLRAPYPYNGNAAEISYTAYDRTLIQLTATVDASGYTRLYVNGVLIDTSTETYLGDLPFASTATLFRTYSKAASGSPVATKLGALRLYNVALTADDIAANYNYERSIGRMP